MSDDEADLELLELLRQSLGISNTRQDGVSSDTGVLVDAEYIYNNAIDVSIEMYGTKAAASSIFKAMQERSYSTDAWSQHELHPKRSEGFSDVDLVNFVFTMDLLNFSFWSELSDTERYQVEYRDKRWTGYNSLVASLRRALDAGIPVTTPRFWRHGQASDDTLGHVFRSATDEGMPMLKERVAALREAAEVLHESSADPEQVQVDLAVQEQSAATPAVSHTHDEQGLAPDIAEDGTGHADTDVEHTVNDTAHVGSEDEHVDVDVPDSQAPDHSDVDTLAPSIENANMSDQIHIDTRTVTDLDSGENGSIQLNDSTISDHHKATAMTQFGKSDEDCTSLTNSIHSGNAQPGRQSTSAPDLSVVRLIEKAERSAGKLVNLLVQHFDCFRDKSRFEGRKVRLYKRAQIFVADLWAAFDGTSYGEFHDIDTLTMFADYRVPQMLHSLGVMSYSPPLTHHISNLKAIPSGHSWEVQLRGCSIWAVELIRREIARNHPNDARAVNAVLIDFFLYDLAKEREALVGFALPHHRTRSIWY